MLRVTAYGHRGLYLQRGGIQAGYIAIIVSHIHLAAIGHHITGLSLGPDLLDRFRAQIRHLDGRLAIHGDIHLLAIDDDILRRVAQAASVLRHEIIRIALSGLRVIHREGRVVVAHVARIEEIKLEYRAIGAFVINYLDGCAGLRLAQLVGGEHQ